MSDAAKLTIEIDDKGDKPGGTGTGADASAELLARWKAMLSEMGRTLDNSGGGGAGRSYSGAGSSRRAGLGRSPDVFTATDAEWDAKIDAREAEWERADEKRRAKRRAAGLSLDEMRKAGLAFGGKPPGVSDEDWEAHGKESAKRGAGAARASMKGYEQAKAAREAEADEAARPGRERRGRGLAWRKAKTYQRRVDKLNQRRTFKRGMAGAVGAGQAAGIRGGGAGRALGSGIGGAVGMRFGGPAGAAVGSAVGEKVGGFVDDPLAGPKKAAKGVAGGDAMGVLSEAADGAAMALAMIPLVGLPAAMTIKMVSSSLGAVKEMADAFAARGRELAGYSGGIAGAAAMQDVTRTLTDIREAQMLGDKYADVIQAQTRFEETLKAGLLPIKDFFLERLPGWLDTVLDFLQEMVKIGYLIPGVKDKAVDKIISEMTAMRKALEGDGLPTGDVVEMWLRAPVLAFDRPAAHPPAMGGPLAVPLLVGP